MSLSRNKGKRASALLMLSLCDAQAHDYNSRDMAYQEPYTSGYLTQALRSYGGTRAV
ncbi:hypothetical protein [Taibaiella helva]|uniref:hypothetical protein n=1 Tax=Taibaiella helva TaxID=2301235 RepID=UPI0013006ADB|nr:hypothetical protein [Taibaiella helva]